MTLKSSTVHGGGSGGTFPDGWFVPLGQLKLLHYHLFPRGRAPTSKELRALILSPARCRPRSLCALDIVAQCRGLLLHFAQPVFDDVADRDDADQLISFDYRNVSELACGHPLHDGER